MAIHFTDADRAAGLACADVAIERFRNGGAERERLAAVFTDKISDTMQPERERAKTMMTTLREIQELAAEAIVHDMIERGLMDRIRSVIDEALGEE